MSTSKSLCVFYFQRNTELRMLYCNWKGSVLASRRPANRSLSLWFETKWQPNKLNFISPRTAISGNIGNALKLSITPQHSLLATAIFLALIVLFWFRRKLFNGMFSYNELRNYCTCDYVYRRIKSISYSLFNIQLQLNIKIMKCLPTCFCTSWEISGAYHAQTQPWEPKIS